MISIIICSASAKLLSEVKENIEKTIGVPYELLSYPNANTQFGICDLYNRGILQAKFGILCFMHEDVLIKTQDWGKRVLESFDAHTSLGLLGVAGSSYKAICPSSWFSWVDAANRFNLIQHFKHRIAERATVYSNPQEEKLSLVVAVDGVWFCARKDIALETKFDQLLLTGFHGYDVDFSLSVGQKWDVAVTFEILLEHFSEGYYDKSWVDNTLLIHQKWKNILPKKVGASLNEQEAKICEKKAFLFFIERMALYGYSKKTMYNVLWNSRLYVVLGWIKFFGLHRYIFSLKVTT